MLDEYTEQPQTSHLLSAFNGTSTASSFTAKDRFPQFTNLNIVSQTMTKFPEIKFNHHHATHNKIRLVQVNQSPDLVQPLEIKSKQLSQKRCKPSFHKYNQ